MNKIRLFSKLEINHEQIEHLSIYLSNGHLQVKLKTYKKHFCVYQDKNLKYYIMLKGKNFYFDTEGQKIILDYINNF